MQSAPNSGWSNYEPNKWAAITVWWKFFGETRWENYISVNGVNLTSEKDYIVWWDKWPTNEYQKITFFLNDSIPMWSTQITVNVDGKESNALDFTIREWNIYFIAHDWENGDGSIDNPFDDMQASGSQGFVKNMNPWDVYYFRWGEYTQRTNWGNSILWIRDSEPSGNKENPISLIAYPWEEPLFSIPEYDNNFYKWVSFGNDYVVFSWFTINSEYRAASLDGNYHRFIWNKLIWLKNFYKAWTWTLTLGDSASHTWNGSIVLWNHISWWNSKNRFDHGIYISGCSDIEWHYLGWNHVIDNDFWRWAQIVVNHQQERCTSKQVVKSHYIFNNTVHCTVQRWNAIKVYDLSYDQWEIEPEPTYVYNNIVNSCWTYDGDNLEHIWYWETIWSSNGHAKFYNNTLYNSGYRSVKLKNSLLLSADFKNNIVHMTPDFPGPTGNIYMDVQGSEWEVELSHNLFYWVWEYTQCWDCISDNNNLYVDPSFVDPENWYFALTQWSPLIDAWYSNLPELVSWAPLTKDMNLVDRWSKFDLWALEYTHINNEPQPEVDTTAPIITNVLPDGELTEWTSNVNITLDTDEVSVCKYSINSQTNYDTMESLFTNTNSLSHSTQIQWLENGNSYTFYIKCSDEFLNKNWEETTVTFSVAASVIEEPENNNDPTKNKLVTHDDFEYIGWFTFNGSTWVSDLEYSTWKFTVDVSDNTIYIASRGKGKSVAHYSIPELSQQEDPKDLNKATQLQPFSYVLSEVYNPEKHDRIWWMWVIGDKLMINSYEYYDAPADNFHTTTLIEDKSDLENSDMKWMMKLSWRAHVVSWISRIPEEWRSLIWWDYMAWSSSSFPISWRASTWPSWFSFQSQDILNFASWSEDTISSTKLLDFDLQHNLSKTESWWAPFWVHDNYNELWDNDLWTAVSWAEFGFIIPGTRTYATFWSSGMHDTGGWYKITQTEGQLCGWPCATSKYDYYNYYWFWDVNDLIKVKQWLIESYEVKPYEYGKFDIPYGDHDHLIKWWSYDHVNEILYLNLHQAYQKSQYTKLPVIQWFKVNNIIDNLAPVITNMSPNEELAEWTTSTSISLNTNEIATCKYSLTQDTNYESMEFTFSNTNSINHSTQVDWLENGGNYTYYIRCKDQWGNENIIDTQLNILVEQTVIVDDVPPLITNIKPESQLSRNIKEVQLSFNTDELATCKYSETANIDYESMTYSFSETNSLFHSAQINNLHDWINKKLFVKCIDENGNINASDKEVQITVKRRSSWWWSSSSKRKYISNKENTAPSITSLDEKNTQETKQSVEWKYEDKLILTKKNIHKKIQNNKIVYVSSNSEKQRILDNLKAKLLNNTSDENFSQKVNDNLSNIALNLELLEQSNDDQEVKKIVQSKIKQNLREIRDGYIVARKQKKASIILPQKKKRIVKDREYYKSKKQQILEKFGNKKRDK
jgi:hypothetical protein